MALCLRTVRSLAIINAYVELRIEKSNISSAVGKLHQSRWLLTNSFLVWD